MKKRIKRTLSCIEKDCKYELMIISEDQNDNFVVYEKLSKKYTAHSKFIWIIFNNIFLDHDLVYEKKNEDGFTQEILKEIDTLKSLSVLTEVINKKFNTEFLLTQIKYQVNKLMLTNFGSPSEDAYLFAQIAEEEARNEGFFILSFLP